MDQYIADNITEEMSEYEVLDVITRFPAQYNYDVRYQGYTDMIVFGKVAAERAQT